MDHTRVCGPFRARRVLWLLELFAVVSLVYFRKKRMVS